MYCYWKFDIDIVNYTFVLSIQGLYNLNGKDRLIISNCKEDVIFDYDSTLNQVWSYTQDSEICVTFNSSEDKVGWWWIKLVLDKGPTFEVRIFLVNVTGDIVIDMCSYVYLPLGPLHSKQVSLDPEGKLSNHAS
uniref:Uncharacterized protein n=1 Tax=Acrobeloides nanus TaxID=290746 RepID=A0A914E2P2_9BILA